MLSNHKEMDFLISVSLSLGALLLVILIVIFKRHRTIQQYIPAHIPAHIPPPPKDSKNIDLYGPNKAGVMKKKFVHTAGEMLEKIDVDRRINTINAGNWKPVDPSGPLNK